MIKGLSVDPYQNLPSLGNIVVIHLQLLANSLQDSIYEGRPSRLIWYLDQMVLGTYDAEHLIRYVGHATHLGFLNILCNVINFLLCDGLGIRDIEAIQVDDLINIILVIDLVESLPSNIIINLLQHFGKLIIGNKVGIIFVHVTLVFLICFLLKVFTDFLKLILYHPIFLPELFLWNLIAIGHLAVGVKLFDARVGAFNVGVSFDDGHCPESNWPLRRHNYDFRGLHLWLWWWLSYRNPILQPRNIDFSL